MTVTVPTVARWLDDPVECGAAAGFGVYLHVPFCAHRCGYCDFATYGLDGPPVDGQPAGALMGRYVAALRAEIRRCDPATVGRPVTSVFVGGGTPTLLPAEDLAGLLAVVTDVFDLAPGVEVTVEANPETATPDLFTALRDAGVNRVSFGAQSFAPHVLRTLERRHDPQRPLEAVATARAAGIGAVNLDLIYGTPGETDADWEASLDAAVAAGVDHVSAYALTVAPNTPLARSVSGGRLPAPDPDVQRRRFDTARTRLAAAGFDHYEVSNWARGAAARSRHNVLYWRHGDYVGLGVGAHSHVAGHRWWAHRSLPRWLAAAEAGEPPVAGEEHLAVAERAEERLLLGLRLREGLHPADVPPLDPTAVGDAVHAGLVEVGCGRLRCSDEGWFLLDEVLNRLL